MGRIGQRLEIFFQEIEVGLQASSAFDATACKVAPPLAQPITSREKVL